jgi:diguanylate cyclase (GGDEF)-like protein/PAS domain S-box-containing protein
MGKVHRPYQVLAKRLAVVAALVFVFTAFTLALNRSTDRMTFIWIANGILVGALLRVSRRWWPAHIAVGFLAGFAARLWLDGRPVVALGIGLANMVEVAIVAHAVRQRFPHVFGGTDFPRLGRVATASTLIACAVSGVMAELVRLAAGQGDFLGGLFAWYRAHVLGMVIVATLTLVALTERQRLFGLPRRRRELALTMLALAAICAAVFSQTRYPILFAVYPPLLWAVFRHRFPGLVLGIALVTLITDIATALGRGPLDLIAGASPLERVILAQVFVGVGCLITLPVALGLAARGYLAARVRDSELRYRTLAEHSSDLVMRIRADGHRLYVSPSVKELLGLDVDEFIEPRSELIHPDDRERVAEAVARLRSEGGSSMMTYRIRHKDGHYVWLEALARRVPSPERKGETEIIYTGRDVTERVLAEQALRDSEQRLRTITDNVPAIIAHIDAQQRYTFINDYVRKISGEDPQQVIGHTVHEVRGESIYDAIKDQIETVLRGEHTMFENEGDIRGKHYHFQSNFVPDIDENGKVRGFYALTTDITHIKQVEQELYRLARFDTLTGLANRRYFNERIVQALQRCHRSERPILLLSLDIDHFKSINDNHGHAIGDAVLREFASRITRVARESDFAARLGGDEFVLLVEDADSLEAAEVLARRLTATMEPDMVFGELRLRVTASIGVAYCRGAPSIDELLQYADEALYGAKGAGRHTYRLVDRETRSTAS